MKIGKLFEFKSVGLSLSFAVIIALGCPALNVNAGHLAVETVGEGVWDTDRDPNVNPSGADSCDPGRNHDGDTDPNTCVKKETIDSDSVYDAAPGPDGEGNDNLPATHLEFFFRDDFNPDPKADPSLHKTDNKDHQYISNWNCLDPGSAPNKNNLVHGLATYVKDGEEYIFGSASKSVGEGSNYVGIWLFQDETIGCPPPAGSFGPFHGQHEDGDWLLISDYSNGGGVASFTASRWNDYDGIPMSGDEVLGDWDPGTGLCSDGSSPAVNNDGANECPFNFVAIDCNPPGGENTDILCATTNTDAFGDVIPAWSVLKNTLPDDTLAPPIYFEFAVSVTKLIIEDPLRNTDKPFCGGKFLLETRSSFSFSASLKDYILEDFRICGDLTVQKITDPAGSSQDFQFDVEDGSATNIDDQIVANTNCPAGASDGGSIDDDLRDSECFNIPDLPVGTYSIEEVNIPGGWDLTSVVCENDEGGSEGVDDSNPNIVNLGTESITCTFTNTELGSIRIEKSTIGGTGSFDYAAAEPDGGTAIADFSRDTSGTNPTVSSAFTNLLPGKAYSFTETVPSGWDATDLTCSGDTNSTVTIDETNFDDVSIILAPGEDIVCTFENTKRSMIVIEKETVGGTGTFNFTPVGFSMTGGNSLTTTAAGEGGVDSSTTEVVSGSYSISENGPPAGWDLTSATCDSGETIGSIDVEPGETVTCRFVNTKDGEIVIEKVTIGDAGSFNYTPVGFSMTGGNSLTTTVEGVPGVVSKSSGFVTPGSGYSISETVPAGWDLTSATCDSGETIGSIDVEPGETVTCRFVNTKDGEIVIEKVTIGDVGSFNYTPVGFSMTGGNSLTTTVEGVPGVVSKSSGFVTPGSGYSISETVPAGWDLTSATCDSGETIGSIDVEPGETVTCRFVNTKDGEIVIEKVTIGDVGSFNYTPVGFSMTGGNSLTTTIEGVPGLVSKSSGFVTPGSGYSISETVPAGWDLTSATCDSGETIGSIDVEPGETVTCRFVNTKDGEIVIEKVTIGDVGSFNYTPVGFSMTGGNSLTTTIEGVPGLVSKSSGFVTPGSGYSISETVPAGWDLTSATCDSGETIGSIDVEPGETVTCRFENTRRGDVDLIKLSNGIQTTSEFNFTLNGPGGVNESDNTTPVIDFGYPNPPGDKWLVANETYTICETGIPAGTTSHWFVNAQELPFVGQQTGNLMEVYNPDDDGGPEPDDLGNRCVDFQVGPGGAIVFEVDSRTPLGDARTPGYWKNWSSCSNGNQFGKAAYEYDNDPSGLIDARHYTLDEILTEAYSKTPAPLNAIHAYDTGVWIGNIALDGDSSGNAYDQYLFDGSLPDADCDEAVLVLNSADQQATKGGKGKAVNHSSDPAYKLGRYLLAFIANQTAGAYQCDLAADAAEAAQILLSAINFDGTGEFLSKKGIQQNHGSVEQAENALYYHGILGQYVENDPGLNCGALLSPPNP